MKNLHYKINEVTVIDDDNITIMTVGDVSKGEAISLSSNNLVFDENFIHASSVPFLVTGDRVIVQKISGLFTITDKLRTPGDKPTVGFEVNDDGSLSLFSEVSIVLQTLNTKINIFENGKIMIEGKEVYSISKGVNRIQGTNIELN